MVAIIINQTSVCRSQAKSVSFFARLNEATRLVSVRSNDRNEQNSEQICKVH